MGMGTGTGMSQPLLIPPALPADLRQRDAAPPELAGRPWHACYEHVRSMPPPPIPELGRGSWVATQGWGGPRDRQDPPPSPLPIAFQGSWWPWALAEPQRQLRKSGTGWGISGGETTGASGVLALCPPMLTPPIFPPPPQIAYSSSSPGNYVVSIGVHLWGGHTAGKPAVPPPLTPQLTSLLSPHQGPPGGGGPPGTPILPSPGGECLWDEV